VEEATTAILKPKKGIGTASKSVADYSLSGDKLHVNGLLVGDIKISFL
jgi:hypothetical protein